MLQSRLRGSDPKLSIIMIMMDPSGTAVQAWANNGRGRVGA